jgi:hypothetical protein
MKQLPGSYCIEVGAKSMAFGKSEKFFVKPALSG